MTASFIFASCGSCIFQSSVLRIHAYPKSLYDTSTMPKVMSQRMSISPYLYLSLYISLKSSQMHSICSVLVWETLQFCGSTYSTGAGKK